MSGAGRGMLPIGSVGMVIMGESGLLTVSLAFAFPIHNDCAGCVTLDFAILIQMSNFSLKPSGPGAKAPGPFLFRWESARPIANCVGGIEQRAGGDEKENAVVQTRGIASPSHWPSH